MGRDVAVTLLSGELAAAALNNPLSQFSSSPFSMALPYYDLAVSHTLLEAQTQRERVSQAIKLGWDAVALVHQAAAKLGEQQDRCVPLQAHFGQRGRLPPPACTPPASAFNSLLQRPFGGACRAPIQSPFPTTLPHRCAIRPVELEALLSAAQGVREALAAAEQRGGPRHGDPYSVRQLTRINIPADDPAAAQVGGPCCWLHRVWDAAGHSRGLEPAAEGRRFHKTAGVCNSQLPTPPPARAGLPCPPPDLHLPPAAGSLQQRPCAGLRPGGCAAPD